MLYSVAENTPLSKLPEFSDDFYALIKHLEYHSTPDAADEIFKGTAGQKLELTRWFEGSRDRQKNPLNVYLLNVGNEEEVEALEEDNEVMFKMFVRCSNYNRRSHWLSEKDPKLMRLAAMYYLERRSFSRACSTCLPPNELPSTPTTPTSPIPALFEFSSCCDEKTPLAFSTFLTAG